MVELADWNWDGTGRLCEAELIIAAFFLLASLSHTALPTSPSPTPDGTSTVEQSGSDNSTMIIIIAAACGGGVVLLMLCVIVLIYLKRRRTTQGKLF